MLDFASRPCQTGNPPQKGPGGRAEQLHSKIQIATNLQPLHNSLFTITITFTSGYT